MLSYDVYVGVDVGKSSLEVSPFDRKPGEINNTQSGIQRLVRRIKALDQSVMVCCEATGGYERLLIAELHQSGIPIALVNPRPVRDFAKSKGYLAKTDKIDAGVIADFARVNSPRLFEPPKKWRKSLKALMIRRDDLLEMKKQEQNRLDPAPEKEMGKMIRTHLRMLERHIEKIDELIDQLLKETEEYKVIHDRITEIKGVGDLSAAAFAAFIPELGALTDKQAAALVGVAPYNNDSGTFKGKRRTIGGRARVRKILYMAAVSASSHNPVLKVFYQRLITNRKPAKVALTAVMRKMVCLASRLLANPDFQLAKTT